MQKVVVYVKDFNDLDHLAPICLCYLERGESVRILLDVGNEELQHPILDEMTAYSNFELTKVSRLDHLRLKCVENKVIRLLTTRMPGGGRLKSAIYALWANRLLVSCDLLLCGWTDPYQFNFQEALHRGISAVCLPHGYNIFTNYDVNSHIKSIWDTTGRWPDFSGRNGFTKYVVNSPQSQRHAVDWGLDSQKVENWGSVRFDPAYAKRLCSVLPKFCFPLNEPSDLKIVFFLPHLNYHVSLADLFELLNLLASDETITLCIRVHTRKAASPEAVRFLTLLEKLEREFANVHLERKAFSASIVRASDLVMAFGSSIAIEALIQQKPLIYLAYLDRNSSIFDDSKVARVAKSHADCLALVSAAKRDPRSLVGLSQEVSSFFHLYVYNDDSHVNVSKRYVDNLQRLRRPVKFPVGSFRLYVRAKLKVVYKRMIFQLKFQAHQVLHVKQATNRNFCPGSNFKFVFHTRQELERVLSSHAKELLTQSWIRAMPPQSVFWDVGANIGVFSFLAALTGLRVVSLEPLPANVLALTKSLYANPTISGSVMVVPLALAESDGAHVLEFDSPNGAEAAMSGAQIKECRDDLGNRPLNDSTFAFQVLSLSGDTLASHLGLNFRPNYLKIDVDGKELEVLQGLRGILSTNSVHSLLVETQDSDHHNEIQTFLAEFGFKTKSSDWEPTVLSDPSGSYNRIFRRTAAQTALLVSFAN